MTRPRLVNTHIAGHTLLPAPRDVREALPADAATLATVAEGRKRIREILDGKDRRLLLVVGPCSVHDPDAALEYAGRLRELAARVEDRFVIAMRVYFEKPRTTVGWKGLINDPYMDDSFHIEHGIKIARELLLKITRLGLYAASEALDPITPQYLSELVSWHAIGARTIESQTHRELASGLSSPVGFKNGTDGNVQVAIDAMRSALRPHHFLGVDARGRISVFRTRGNPDGHIVLRGGRQPNYDPASIRRCMDALKEAGLPRRVMVDCSHGNSRKDPKRQPVVFRSCLEQRRLGNRAIIGMMLESNLKEGSQPIPKELRKLVRGVSVTDACLGWDDTERLILDARC